jgi:hypothetical protein
LKITESFEKAYSKATRSFLEISVSFQKLYMKALWSHRTEFEIKKNVSVKVHFHTDAFKTT